MTGWRYLVRDGGQLYVDGGSSRGVNPKSSNGEVAGLGEASPATFLAGDDAILQRYRQVHLPSATNFLAFQGSHCFPALLVPRRRAVSASQSQRCNLSGRGHVNCKNMVVLFA